MSLHAKLNTKRILKNRGFCRVNKRKLLDSRTYFKRLKHFESATIIT